MSVSVCPAKAGSETSVTSPPKGGVRCFAHAPDFVSVQPDPIPLPIEHAKIAGQFWADTIRHHDGEIDLAEMRRRWRNGAYRGVPAELAGMMMGAK